MFTYISLDIYMYLYIGKKEEDELDDLEEEMLKKVVEIGPIAEGVAR